MKVALLTFHNSLNYGAALQAYATQQAISSMGPECIIVDYQNDKRRDASKIIMSSVKSLKKRDLKNAAKYVAGGFFIRRRKRKFSRFYEDNITKTSECYTLGNELKGLNDMFNTFIIGSDQVWNYRNNGTDFAYLLDFVGDDKKKISYSSSFGLAEIPVDLRNRYAELLNRINYLSTRESYGIQIIKKLTGRDAELVLDPVFLLDKSQWLSLCKNEPKKDKYVFCYTNRPNQWRDFIMQTNYSTKNLKVYKITRHLTVRDFISLKVRSKYSISPTDFINTVANAELVVTASFHGIAMAIILNVPFVALLTGDPGKDERILNILRITGLEDRIFSEEFSNEKVNEPIDFISAEKKLEVYRRSSTEFLKHAIFS